MPSRPAMRCREITRAGSTRPSCMSSISEVPPAMRCVSSGCWARRSKVSASDWGWWSWNGRTRVGLLGGDADVLASDRRGPHLGRGQDTIDDLVVAGAAAQVAHHPLLDLLGCWVRHRLEQRGRGDDLARRADAALEAAASDEGVLQWAEVLVVWRQALDG